jgi:7-carboxy-7-deazaguanine synthase
MTEEREKPRKMPIMEIFGPTIQGEGMVMGKKTMFVRTGGCDYSCAWCDSAFTWNGHEKATMMSPQEVYDRLMELGMKGRQRNFDHVTLTGGNPALISEPINQLIDLLHRSGIKVALETQGSRWQNWFFKIDDLTLSPKPPSSKMKTDFNILDSIVENITKENVNFSLKVVVFDDTDFEYAKMINHRYPHANFFLSVGNEDVAEQGNISQRLLNKLEWLMNKVIDDPEMNAAKPLPQMHTLVWYNRRGV